MGNAKRSNLTKEQVNQIQFQIRKLLLEKSFDLKIGHLGSCFSVVEIIISLITLKKFKFENFILSKGHAYNTLLTIFQIYEIVKIPKLFYKNTHPSHKLSQIPFSTGSLGQGITYATGISFANSISRNTDKIYVLISDAELNSGSTHEALQFIANKKLNNMIIIVDNNGQQAIDFTKNVINNDKYIKSLSQLGFDVHTVDGHNISKISKILNKKSNKPIFINCKTISGFPLPFMMGKIEWHYKNISNNEIFKAKKFLENYYAR